MSWRPSNPRPAGAAAGAAAPVDAVPRAAGTVRAEARPLDATLLRLLTFGALAAFAAAHWSMLVVEASADRTALVVAVALGGACALAALGRAPLPRPLLWAAAALIGFATLVLGLVAAGLDVSLLRPKGWSEFADGLDRGLAGVQGVEWPYGGPDEWIRLTILLGAPLLLAIAATLAFWPARRAAPVLRAAGLVALLFLYGAAVTEYDPGEPLLRGLVLLLLVAAYLWLPRLPAREAALAAAVVAAVGLLSLPVASALDGERAWWDYRAWSWFGEGKQVTFDWTHQYGPLDWSRDGTTLLNVKSDRPHYWKAQTLDGFDGFRWYRTSTNDQARTGAEFPFKRLAEDGDGRWDYFEPNRRWDEDITFTVRSLSSTLVVGAGLTYNVEGIRAVPAGDGTTRLLGDEPLRKGDSYSIETYAPDPSAEQMRGAPDGYADGYISYTAMSLPNPGESATEDETPVSDQAIELAGEDRQSLFVPLRGQADSGSGPGALAELRDSPYAEMYELSQRLTASEPTAYDAVKAVERHLQDNYTYSERVPTRQYPLNGFLFQEERGYCQQFSGAMALMLRMAGIPARVAAGFSPGSFNSDTGEFRVRDLDAHSWVEVWFTGIGWVPFDPTPAASPAESQASALATSAAAGDVGEAAELRREGVAAERGSDTGAVASTSGEGADWVIPVLLLLVLGTLAGAGFLVTRRARRLHALGPAERSEAQLAELRRALAKLGWDVPARTTLLALERRLGRTAGPASQAYAGALRASRFDPGAPAGPDLGSRRAVRRELSRGSVGERLRGLVAMPPGGPRP